MKKNIIVALGLAVLASPAFVKPETKFIEPEPPKPFQIPESNEFIRKKILESRRRRK